MKKVTLTNVNAKEDREAWLALRRQHITATDWPKITGTSRWGTEADVISDKNIDADEDYFQPSLPMRVGTELEPLIIEIAMEMLGPGEYLTQQFVSRKHIGFTPDLLQIHTTSDWVLVEIKVSVKDWNDAVPPDYLDQVKFQATVLGIDQVQIVHLKLASWQEGLEMIRSGYIPEDSLTRYLVDINEGERKQIERKADRWWKFRIGDREAMNTTVTPP